MTPVPSMSRRGRTFGFFHDKLRKHPYQTAQTPNAVDNSFELDLSYDSPTSTARTENSGAPAEALPSLPDRYSGHGRRAQSPPKSQNFGGFENNYDLDDDESVCDVAGIRQSLAITNSTLGDVQRDTRLSNSSILQKVTVPDANLNTKGIQIGRVLATIDRDINTGLMTVLSSIREGFSSLKRTYTQAGFNDNDRTRQRNDRGIHTQARSEDTNGLRQRNNQIPQDTPRLPQAVDYGDLSNIVAWDGSRELAFEDLHIDIKTELLRWSRNHPLREGWYKAAEKRKKSCARNLQMHACVVTTDDWKVACDRCVGAKSFCVRRRAENDPQVCLFPLVELDRTSHDVDSVGFWRYDGEKRRPITKALYTKKLYR